MADFIIEGPHRPAGDQPRAIDELSEGLQRSGALSTLARWMVRYGTTPTRLLLMVVVVSGFVSAFVNNTAAVAVFIPLVLAAANANQLSPSKLLIPLSYASQLGGVCTLLGTSTNLLVASVAVSAGVGQLGVFAPTPYGLIVFAFGAIYLLVLSPWLLPARRGADLTENYSLGDYISELAVTSGSALVGKRIRMQPKAVDIAGSPQDFSFPPRHGEHTEALLKESGYGDGDIARFREAGVISGPAATVAAG